MKRLPLIFISLAVLLPGCGAKKEKMDSSSKNTQMTKVDIPMADDGIKSFFDEDIKEFSLAEDDTVSQETKGAQGELVEDGQDFAWVEESTQNDELQVAYFDFDSAVVKPEQSKKIDENARVIKEKLAQAEKEGKEMTVSVQGHACHSAGSAAYNLVKSEERAKKVADCLEIGGIPRDKLKVVGFGDAVPAIIEGKKVTGDKKQQWANRRVELYVTTA